MYESKQNFTIYNGAETLEIKQIFNGVKRTFSYIQAWVSEGGRNSKISAKKAIFLVRVARQKFHHFRPP